MLNQPENTWDKQLPKALYILRSRENEATGYTPSKLILGYTLPREGDWLLPTYSEERRNKESREERIERAKRRRQVYQRRYVQEGTRPEVEFQRGDKVMVPTFERRKDAFTPVWEGPYSIAKRISSTIYEVERHNTKLAIHIDDLRRAPKGTEHVIFERDEEDDPEPPEGTEEQRDVRESPTTNDPTTTQTSNSNGDLSSILPLPRETLQNPTETFSHLTNSESTHATPNHSTKILMYDSSSQVPHAEARRPVGETKLEVLQNPDNAPSENIAQGRDLNETKPKARPGQPNSAGAPSCTFPGQPNNTKFDRGGPPDNFTYVPSKIRRWAKIEMQDKQRPFARKVNCEYACD